MPRAPFPRAPLPSLTATPASSVPLVTMLRTFKILPFSYWTSYANISGAPSRAPQPSQIDAKYMLGETPAAHLCGRAEALRQHSVSTRPPNLLRRLRRPPLRQTTEPSAAHDAGAGTFFNSALDSPRSQPVFAAAETVSLCKTMGRSLVARVLVRPA